MYGDSDILDYNQGINVVCILDVALVCNVYICYNVYKCSLFFIKMKRPKENDTKD